MLTNDKTITLPEYWNRIYNGQNNNAKVDASNNKRPANFFDRFTWVANHAEGSKVLGIASGHAYIERRIKAVNPEWFVVASDQAEAARKATNFRPYEIINVYSIPYPGKFFDTLIISQALEYMEYPVMVLNEVMRVAKKFLLTVPINEMAKWSQLFIYTEENVREMLEPYGTIEVFEREGDLLLVKLKFND